MSTQDGGGHSEDQRFQARIEVPRGVRENPEQLRQWLNAMAVELMNAEAIDVDEDADQSDAGGPDWVQVTMNIHPCPGRFPIDDDDDQGDDDGPGDDGGARGAQT